MEYYLAKTRNKILMYPIVFHEPWKLYVKWKTLVKNKTTYCVTPALWNIHSRQIYSDRKWNSGHLGLVVSWMIQVWPLKGTGFLFRVMKMLQNWLWWWLPDSGNIQKTTEMYTWNGWTVWYVSYISIICYTYT